jgi:hypothetical protein
MDVPEELMRLAQVQSGVVTRRQVLDARVPVEEVRSAMGRTWRMVLPGVVLLAPGLPTLDQRLVAAQLYAGPEAWFAGLTAATLLGLPNAPEPQSLRRIDMLVPAPRRPRDVSWLSIRRTHLLHERLVERRGLRISCRPRAVVDAAAAAPTEREARALVIAAVQRRLVRPQDVQHWIEARRPNGRLRLRAALDEAMAGVWSVPEGDLVRLLQTSTILPEVMANPELRDDRDRLLTTPDVWIDDVALAVMVHSRQFHGGELDWEATVESDSDLTSARIAVVSVTPGSIQHNPLRLLHRVEQAYLAAKQSGYRAPVRATPRSVLLAAS